MTPFPTFESERLRFRGWREEDHAVVAAIYGDPDHARFIGGAMSPQRAWRAMAGFIGHQALRGFSLMALEEKASGVCIGWCGPWRPHGWPENEIGYSLLPSATGRGYAREAAARALAYAYDVLGWTTAISLIDERNDHSKKVARALGAIHDGNAMLFDDEPAEVWRHLPPDVFAARFPEGRLT